MLKQLGRMLDAVVAVRDPAAAARRLQDRMRYEQLSVYDAARRDRTNRDWRAHRGSADAAIMPDMDLLRDRARSLRRDNWIADGIVEAYGRNVVGQGVMPVATVAGDDGAELSEVNEALDTLFARWASRKRYSDVCRKQNFWEKQRMAVEETVEAGEHFWIWSYTYDPAGVVPGLRLQSFEPEQLDIAKVQNQATGNQIRRGIEVDAFGAPVAYWFYDQPLNDYYGFQPSGTTGSTNWESTPYPADRVFHFMRQKRVRQTHGVTRLTPSMRRIRDVDSFDDATLLSAKTEAMPALQINREDPPGGGIDGLRAGGPQAAGPAGIAFDTDADGDREDREFREARRRYELEPAMIFEGRPGETVQVVNKQSGGSNYTAFMMANVGAAASGAGLSRSVVAHDYTQGTYSGERQGALQDGREYGCWQNLIEDELQTLWELFVRFAFLEDDADGRYGLAATLDDFLADPHGFCECEWVPDGIGWVDPAKEAAADSIALDKRLTTRKEIIARKFGKNWRRVFKQLADEQAYADQVGITLPDVEPLPPKTAGDAVPPPSEEGEQPPPPAPPPPAKPKPSPAGRVMPPQREKPVRPRARRSRTQADALVDAVMLDALRSTDEQQ